MARHNDSPPPFRGSAGGTEQGSDFASPLRIDELENVVGGLERPREIEFLASPFISLDDHLTQPLL
jgi:hypothetical protein